MAQTGYTSRIINGEITTGKDFLIQCLRAFGYCISQRDMPLDVPPVRNISYSSDIERKKMLIECTKKEIEQYESMRGNIPMLLAKRLEIHNQIVGTYTLAFERAKENDAKLSDVLAQVEAWVPPTYQHKKIKDFAIDQIKMSMECDEIQNLLMRNVEPFDSSDDATAQWLEDQLDYFKKRLEQYETDITNIKKAEQEANDFLDTFYESVGNMDEGENKNGC